MKEQGLVDRFCAYNRAMSEPTRLKMVKLVASNDPFTMNVSSIAATLNISQPTATKHLKILESVGAFERCRRGTNVYYSLRQEALDEYHQLIDDAFSHVFTICNYGYDCHSCPYEATCN